MSDSKKFALWIKGLLRREEESDSSFCSYSSKKSKKQKRSKSASPKRYYVGEPYPEVYLTQREMEIAILLIQGWRYKPISEQLSLSIRTIEFYIQNIKLKFHCDNKKALVSLLRKIEIIHKSKL